MSEESIFQQQDPAAQVAQTVVDPKPAIQLPQEVTEFVGTGKKYSTVEDALKSVPHAQKHIQTLEQELAQMKEELTKRKTTEELLDEIKSGVPQVATTTQVGLDQDSVTQIVTQAIEQREIQRTSQQNINTVINTFNEKFGEKAPEMYEKIAQESGLTVTTLNKLAATSPSAVLRLAGLDGKQTVTTPAKIGSSINTESIPSGTNNQQLSAKVKPFASTKDLVNAWKIAGEKVKQQLG